MSRPNIFADLQSPYPTAPFQGPMIDAPPPYAPSFSYPGNAGQWSSPAVPIPVASVGHASVGMKLQYVDFVPHVIRKHLFGKDDFETFRYRVG